MRRIYTASFRPWTPGYAWFGRDSGLVTEGLRQAGAESRLVILQTVGMPSDERFLPATTAQFRDPAFWSDLKLDAVVLQGGAEAITQPVADAIRSSGTKLFCRMDTDGIIDPCVNPWLFLYGKWWSSANRYRVRYLIWEEHAWAKEASRAEQRTGRPVTMDTTLTKERFLLAMRTIARPFTVTAIVTAKLLLPRRYGCGRLGVRLAKADAIFAESGLAAARLQRVLHSSGLGSHCSKVVNFPIPIPTRPVVSPDQRRDKIVITAGRLYDDQKDSEKFVKLMARFLAIRKDYRAVAIGDGFRYVQNLVDRHASEVKSRIELIGRSQPERIRSAEESSRIFVCTSRGESMHIASAEAVCAGCSVVGPAEIASMQVYTSQRSGTLSVTRRLDDMLDALIAEADAWDVGKRDPSQISADFTKLFCPLEHARNLLDFCEIGRTDAL